MTEKAQPTQHAHATEKPQPTEKAVHKVEGAREAARQESAKAGEKATEKRQAERTDNPDSPQTDDPRYHAPSTPDQASEAEKDAADNPASFRGIEGEIAPDNEIEANVRRMAGEGRTSGEIAAYKADALAKLG